MTVKIRPETPDDAKAIRDVTIAAFKTAPHKSGTEQDVVEALRNSDALTVSLVAEVDGEIVGHVAVSPVSISDGTPGWFGLGPISVHPKHQRSGIGSLLMERALQRLKTQGAKGCVLLGDPNYYGRFGFKNIPELILPGVPAEYFQALEFGRSFPTGTVTYHDAFVVKS